MLCIWDKVAQPHFGQVSMWLDLSGGTRVRVLLAWFSSLLHASAEQREQVSVAARGYIGKTWTQTSPSMAWWLGEAARPVSAR